jgi:cation diffusion facilitator CzcD-associated flavoprotein CzcO
MSLDTGVLIIGAGLSGIGMAVELIRKTGIRNFEIIEKASDVGGTWLANSYPGCGCDVRTSSKLSREGWWQSQLH